MGPRCLSAKIIASERTPCCCPAFARPRRAERAVDLCSGCGIVALRWHDLGHRGECLSVELDAEGTDLLEQAVAEQPECGHIRPLNRDLNELKADGGYHLVAANPPYFTGGYVSPEAARATARHEGGCTLEQVAAAAARLLRDGGRFALCNRPEHLARTCCILSAAGLEPKRLVFAKQTPKDAPCCSCWKHRKTENPAFVLSRISIWRTKPAAPACSCRPSTGRGM